MGIRSLKLLLCLCLLLLIACQNSSQGLSETAVPQVGLETTDVIISNRDAVEGQTVNNLMVFARLYGYIRFFHPSDQAIEADWDQIAINGVHWVYDAQTPLELSERLETFFQPIAPTIRVFPHGEQPFTPDIVLPPNGLTNAQIIMWEHHSLPSDVVEEYKSILLQSAITDETLPANFHDPRQPFQAELGSGVEAAIPLALFVTADGTYPATTSAMSEKPATSALSDELARRLASVIISWNTMQHFYPYFDVVDTNWLEVLPEALARTLTDPDEAAYFDTLRWLIAQLDDGHGAVLSRTVALPSEVPPVALTWAEDQVVVLYVKDEAAELLQPGSIILTIDGQSAIERLAEAEELISAATIQFRRYLALPRLLAGSAGSQITLEVQTPDGRIQSATLTRDRSYRAIKVPRPEMVTELEPGIFYIDLDRVTDSDIWPLLPQLEAAQGIIFDMRGNKNIVSIALLSHLTREPMTSMQFLVPIITNPDRINMNFERDIASLEPVEPYLSAKIVFLTDGSAFSFEETWLNYVKVYQLAEIVGEPTGGTNGAHNSIEIPGWYTIYWTGTRALNQDGSQFHGVGVQPTVPVSRTIAGIAAGRDEQLDTAVAIIKQTIEE